MLLWLLNAIVISSTIIITTTENDWHLYHRLITIHIIIFALMTSTTSVTGIASMIIMMQLSFL